MKQSRRWLGALFLIGALAWLIVSRFPKQVSTDGPTTDSTLAVLPSTGITVVVTPIPPDPSGSGAPELIGEVVLREYGDPRTSPVNDLQLMAGLLRNMTFLVKSINDRPMSGNEDWANALRGRNPASKRFLPDNHRAFNSEGLIVDRWGTPLFFHPVANRRFEIRSAGPDQKMWTADDLHRNDDGTFRGSETLNSSSLFDPLSSPPQN